MLANDRGPTIASSPGRICRPGATSHTDSLDDSATATCSDIGIAVSLRPTSPRPTSTAVVRLSNRKASPSCNKTGPRNDLCALRQIIFWF